MNWKHLGRQNTTPQTSKPNQIRSTHITRIIEHRGIPNNLINFPPLQQSRNNKKTDSEDILEEIYDKQFQKKKIIAMQRKAKCNARYQSAYAKTLKKKTSVSWLANKENPEKTNNIINNKIPIVLQSPPLRMLSLGSTDTLSSSTSLNDKNQLKSSISSDVVSKHNPIVIPSSDDNDDDLMDFQITKSKYKQRKKSRKQQRVKKKMIRKRKLKINRCKRRRIKIYDTPVNVNPSQTSLLTPNKLSQNIVTLDSIPLKISTPTIINNTDSKLPTQSNNINNTNSTTNIKITTSRNTLNITRTKTTTLSTTQPLLPSIIKKITTTTTQETTATIISNTTTTMLTTTKSKRTIIKIPVTATTTITLTSIPATIPKGTKIVPTIIISSPPEKLVTSITTKTAPQTVTACSKKIVTTNRKTTTLITTIPTMLPPQPEITRITTRITRNIKTTTTAKTQSFKKTKNKTLSDSQYIRKSNATTKCNDEKRKRNHTSIETTNNPQPLHQQHGKSNPDTSGKLK